MADCNNGITIPILNPDPCEGCTTNANCVVDENLYAELSLSSNSTQKEINQALYLAFLNLKAITVDLQTQIDNL